MRCGCGCSGQGRENRIDSSHFGQTTQRKQKQAPANPKSPRKNHTSMLFSSDMQALCPGIHTMPFFWRPAAFCSSGPAFISHRSSAQFGERRPRLGTKVEAFQPFCHNTQEDPPNQARERLDVRVSMSWLAAWNDAVQLQGFAAETVRTYFAAFLDPAAVDYSQRPTTLPTARLCLQEWSLFHVLSIHVLFCPVSLFYRTCRRR